MSKLTDKLRTFHIVNSHDFGGHGTVFIYYKAADTGRGCIPAWWAVHRVGYKTDPNAAWYAYGNKTFSLVGGESHKERKAKTLEVAKAWASEKYGIKEWAKDPFGNWMDAEFVKTRLAELLG